MSASDQISQLLREHKAELIRRRKHQVWRFPDGRTFVMASSPSDVHAEDNALRDLRRTLGLTSYEARVGERRERKQGHGRARFEIKGEAPPRGLSFAEKLRMVVPPQPIPVARQRRLKCNTTMWLERIPMTPLWAMLAHVFNYRSSATAGSATIGAYQCLRN